MTTTKSLPVDSELARELADAAQSGKPVKVSIGNRIYSLSIAPEPVDEPTGIWEGYSAEQVRAAVQRSSALQSRGKSSELDSLIAEIRSQRDQSPVQETF